MSSQVHWHEGLFLQPHHLQQMQRGLVEEIHGQRKLAWHYPYGVVESRLEPEELSNHWVHFAVLRVLMPSGVLVEAPGNTVLTPLNIKRELETSRGTLSILLGVPLFMKDRGNVPPSTLGGGTASGEDTATDRGNYHFRVGSVELPDENTGTNPQKISLREINARLLIQTHPEQKFDGIETLPLLRFRRAPNRVEDKPIEDERFAPPSLVLQGCRALRDIVKALANKVEATRNEMADQLGRGGLGGDEHLRAMLRLRTLGRFCGRLGALASVATATPFEFYLLLRELHGELVPLTIANEEASEAFRTQPYNHDDPLPCFEELAGRIRARLVVQQRIFLKTPFNPTSRGFPKAALSDDHLKKPLEYFLGIKTKLERAKFEAYVEDPDRFKLMSASKADVGDWGIQLLRQVAPPPEFPPEKSWSYFKISLRESNDWEQIQRDKSLIIEWNMQELALPDAEFMLFMTLPE